MTTWKPPTFGVLLRRYRDVAGLTQEELAQMAGLSVPTIGNLERGRSQAPHRATIRSLADALELSGEERAGLLACAIGASSDPVESEGPPRRTGRPVVEGNFLGALPSRRLVGREAELGRVLGTLEAVASGAGTGRLVLLAGEAGVGKTRLAQEISVHAWEKDLLVASGRCYESQSGVPFYPFLEALGTLYEEAPERSRGRWPYLERLLPDHFPSQPAAPPSGSQEELQKLLRAVSGFVRDTAARRPVALFIDDLHWADEASLDLLQHLARHTRPDRVLLVGTYRDVEVGRAHPLRKAVRDLRREQLVERVAVGGLGREETAALMADRLDGMEVSEEFAELVYGHTEGNPFFATEVLEALIQRGNLFVWEERWVRSELDRLEVPESVREIIAERTSRLAPEARETLEQASVLGQRFAFEDLRAISDRDEEELEKALEEAGRAGLVRDIEEEHAFNHAITHQAIYADIPWRRRRRLHLSVGEALERHTERVRQQRASEIARHFVEGKAPARALPYALLAGDAAGVVFAHVEAERHYRSALRLAEEVGDRPGAAWALRSLGEALSSAGRYDEALTALESAANLAVELGDPEGEMLAVAQIGWAQAWMGTVDERVVERLWDMAGQDGPDDAPAPPGVSAQTLNLLRGALAALLWSTHDYQRTVEVARRTSILGRRLGDKRVVANAEFTRVRALLYLRRPTQALEVLEEVMPLAEEINTASNPEEAVPLAEKANFTNNMLYGMLSFVILYRARGELRRSLGWAERGLALAKQFDNPEMIATCTGMGVGLSLFYLGEWKEARVHLERLEEMRRSLGHTLHSAQLAWFLIMLCMAEGSWEEATRLLEDATAMAEDVGWSVLLHSAQSLWAQLDLLQDRPQNALARLKPLADMPDLHINYATILPTLLAEAHLELGDPDKAREFSERALREAEAMDNRFDAVGALRIKAMALDRQGLRDEAASTLEETLAMVRSMPYPYEEAKLSREYGMLHVHAGEPRQARERLSAALEIFRRLGASKDAERTEQALGELRPA